MGSRVFRSVVVALVVIGTVVAFVPMAEAGSQSYRVQLDNIAPNSEPWAFLRFFPGSALSIHQGDVLDFAWGGVGTPHTATVVGDADPAHWRQVNQGSGGAYESPIPDSQVGGDDHELIENPKEVAPSDPTCGTVVNPCSFDGTSVVTSGFHFGDPSAQPSFAVKITAPVGGYAFLCLLHPGMEVQLNVVADATSVPSPQEVAATAAQEETQAATVDGAKADHQAQTVHVVHTTARSIIKVSAGGFSKGVSANEYPDNPIVAHVGDRIKLYGTGEIHTGTFPKKAVNTTPFIQTVCEVTGPDTPATSPADCSDPSKFEIVLNPKAFLPTKSNVLRNPTAFVNSGLVVGSLKHAFEARKPGVYHFVCLVHGPSMSGTIRIVA